jgi:phage terminase large subunit-like protein
LWPNELVESVQVKKAPDDLDRIVVALDPAITSGSSADECGIVVVGAHLKGPPQDWKAYVLADCTIKGARPSEWAQAAISAMEQFGADRLVAEVNQGGQMVAEVVRQVDPLVPYRAVHATRGKVARAEPIAALYEQGRVKHVTGDLEKLEAQMNKMTSAGYEGTGSPDRVDALVWALHDLMIDPAAKWRQPGVRSL